jgi:hypothetical protein
MRKTRRNSPPCRDIALQLSDRATLCELYDRTLHSDVTLRITTPSAQFFVSTHRAILHAHSAYFRQRMAFGDLAPELSLQLEETFDEPLVRGFFRLFYVPLTTLDAEETRFVQENVLFLHELALYTQFEALRLLCENVVFDALSLDLFKMLNSYCLTRDDQERYHLGDERRTLYERALEWYVCCVEDAPFRLEPPPPLESPGRLPTTYFSTHKYGILRAIAEQIVNLAPAALPSRAVTQNGLSHYVRLCTTCARDEATQSWRLRSLRAPDGEIHSFVLQRSGQRRYKLELHLERTQNGMEVEADPTRYHCRHKLLSKRNSEAWHESEAEALATPGAWTLASIRFPNEQFCYEAVCDCCRHGGRSVFIVIVQLSKHPVV